MSPATSPPSSCSAIYATASSVAEWHTAYQILMSLCYFALSVRLVQLIMAFRGG
jgi:hypothetical protein